MILNGKQEVKVEVSDEDIMMAALQIYKKRIGREEFATLSRCWAKSREDYWTCNEYIDYTKEEKIIINMFMYVGEEQGDYIK